MKEHNLAYSIYPQCHDRLRKKQREYGGDWIPFAHGCIQTLNQYIMQYFMGPTLTITGLAVPYIGQ